MRSRLLSTDSKSPSPRRPRPTSSDRSPAGPGGGVELEPTAQDGGLTAAVLGLFSAAWCSWTPEATGAAAVATRVVAVAGVVVSIVGACVALRHRGTSRLLSDPSTSRRYGLVVAAELVVAVVGVVLLSAAGAEDLVPVWLCGVVGVHLVPLASVLRRPLLRWSGMALVGVAGGGILVGAASDTAPSTVIGLGAGATLLVTAVLALATPGAPDDRPVRSS